MSIPRHVAGMITVGLMVASADRVLGQDYPNRPIRIVTGSAGGGSDSTSRLVAQGISGPFGQTVIVENRPTGVIPGEIVSKATPDGYTLFITGSNFWIGPLLRKVPYDPVKDFTPVTLISREILVFAVHPSVAANSIKELIALAKAKPAELSYASASIGGPGHLAMELFKGMAGVDIRHIPYNGGGPLAAALLRGEVQLAISDGASMAPHVKAGKLKALAITSAEPSVLAPGLPTLSGSGLPGYEVVNMTGMFAPSKTPMTIIKRVNEEVVRFVHRPDVKEKFLNARGEIVGNSPEQFAAIVKTDMAKMRKVISDAGITAN